MNRRRFLNALFCLFAPAPERAPEVVTIIIQGNILADQKYLDEVILPMIRELVPQ
jgi:hypothetical protein